MIKDCAVILPDAVLAPDTVVPPFAIFGGAPARPVGKVPDNHQEAITELTTTFYQNTKVEDLGTVYNLRRCKREAKLRIK